MTFISAILCDVNNLIQDRNYITIQQYRMRTYFTASRYQEYLDDEYVNVLGVAGTEGVY